MQGNDDSFSGRLRSARQLTGLSARALDAKAQLTPGHTALIESGARPTPGVGTAAKLAVALGVSLNWLVFGNERPTGTYGVLDQGEKTDVLREIEHLRSQLDGLERDIRRS